MSMSQEDIEALMSGIELPKDEEIAEPSKEDVSDEKVDTSQIEELLSQSDKKEEVASPSSENKINEIENLLNDIEETSVENAEVTEEQSSNIEDKAEVNTKVKEEDEEKAKDEIVKEWSSSKINEGVFPFPVENDTKVVSQLSQVANDSEEKVSQIFDVLSIALDNNGDIRKRIKEYEEFTSSQANLLNSLISKFPNIKIFGAQLEKVKTFEESLQSLKMLLDDEDMQIFQGMELMQFNDINRQKIERVMSVIRKLSLYLNNLFEEENPKEIPTAKHIYGDSSTQDLVGDDLDKLIAEFND